MRLLLLWFALLIGPVYAAEPHEHQHPAIQVHFPTSCQPDGQASFDRAVTLLHSFDFSKARQVFMDVADRDPDCGMAWWGVAMTWPLPPTGGAAAERATELGAKTQREQGYIAAIGSYYRGADELDPVARGLAYRAAMAQLAADFPEDHEASIFYALALLTTGRPEDTSLDSQKLAGEILNRLVLDHPEHPGIIHYTIHAFDHSDLAELAVPAARIYAKIAPDSSHALHMPSHIFTRLGLWEESIASNVRSARVADGQASLTSPGAVSFEKLHAMDYLAYAYLQLGEDEKAREVVEEVVSAQRVDHPNFTAAYALASVPARYVVERRDWQAAAQLELPQIELAWENFPYAQGNIYYARALGNAHLGQLLEARESLSALAKLQKTLAKGPESGSYDWTGWIEAMRLAAAGWLAYAEDKKEEAVRLLISAAELEEKVGKHPVTPGPLLPAREQLGDLFLALESPEAALAAYESILAESPNRLNSLAGAGQGAERSGEAAQAKAHYERLLALCRTPACRRPAAARAACFLNDR